MNGYPISAEAFDLEIYQLYCIFYASRKLHGLSSKHKNLNWLLKTFEQSELSKKLISIAVIIRNMKESNNKKDFEKVFVGEIIPDENKPNIKNSLSVREACNKLIHAIEIDFYPDRDNITDKTPISDKIELNGQKNNKNWIANIEVSKFISAICSLT